MQNLSGEDGRCTPSLLACVGSSSCACASLCLSGISPYFHAGYSTRTVAAATTHQPIQHPGTLHRLRTSKAQARDMTTETVQEPKAAAETTTALPADTLTKYKTAAEIAAKALQLVISKAVKGANLLELCREGDKSIEDACALVYNKDKKTPTQKGVASHALSVSTSAHIDGYASISGETVIVGASASPVTGPKADLVAAAHNVTELVLRSINQESRTGKLPTWSLNSSRNTTGRSKEWRNVIDGKKTINLFPAAEQHRDKDSTFLFEEGDVFGLDVLLTSGEETKSKSHVDRTSIFQKTTSTYQLKMKTSRSTYGEIVKKAGAFPFTLRTLEDQTRPGWVITPAPTFYIGSGSEIVKSEVKIQDEELASTLARSLKPKRPRKLLTVLLLVEVRLRHTL
ncbi:hypothetical protein PSTT_16541 [Puccinia striiformis]|uniref:Peptidase M24 domain-containing protein n=1 Tax=Puccinia striiformis TaxID=27350 RepID=A0A2S4UCH4_9BASI|nr:hypothetical protein PSTT_16541 [Puccinia striiformis]